MTSSQDAGMNASAAIGETAHNALADRAGQFLARAGCLDGEHSMAELHRVRIAAKRLRYTLETFQPALGVEGSEVIAQLTRLQVDLGDVHDLDVLVNLIESEYRALAKSRSSRAKDLRTSLKLLRKHERNRRAELRATVTNQWREVDRDILQHSLRRLVGTITLSP